MTRSELEGKIFSALNEYFGHEEYKHWVFCAGKFPENEEVIKKAKKAIEYLEDLWEMNADVHGHYEGPEFVIHEEGANVEIQAVSNDLSTLINGCMAFAREMAK
jgi:hypothetical protein